MNDNLKNIILLSLLAYLGLILPFIAWGLGLGILSVGLLIVFFWFLPGAPYPLVHMFFGGWMPFIIAYPLLLILACEDYLDQNKRGG